MLTELSGVTNVGDLALTAMRTGQDKTNDTGGRPQPLTEKLLLP